jgi:hypothetical protein
MAGVFIVVGSLITADMPIEVPGAGQKGSRKEILQEKTKGTEERKMFNAK